MERCLFVSPFSSLPMKISSSAILKSLESRKLARSIPQRRHESASRIWASPNESRRRSSDGIMMVDPLEAKRLAAKQLQEIQAKEKLRRQRRIEAINGACAMIGLTAGLVAESQTGKGIISQLAGYFDAIISFFTR